MKTILSFITILTVLITVGCSKKTETVTPESPKWGTLTIINTSWSLATCTLSYTKDTYITHDSATFTVLAGTGVFSAYYLIPGYHGSMDTTYWTPSHMKGVDSTGHITILSGMDTKIHIRSEQMP